MQKKVSELYATLKTWHLSRQNNVKHSTHD